jgi:hypothetical protein
MCLVSHAGERESNVRKENWLCAVRQTVYYMKETEKIRKSVWRSKKERSPCRKTGS